MVIESMGTDRIAYREERSFMAKPGRLPAFKVCEKASEKKRRGN